MTYLTTAGVIHADILGSCRSHTLRLFTPAGVIHTDILDSGLQESCMEILESCRSHTLRQVNKNILYETNVLYI